MIPDKKLLTLFGLAAVLALTCSPRRSIQESAPSLRQRPTLLIINNGFENLRVTDEFDRLVVRVFSGETRCVTLRRDALQRLYFEQPYKLEEGPLFSPFSEAGWEVKIGNTLVYDVLSLKPAERCEKCSARSLRPFPTCSHGG